MKTKRYFFVTTLFLLAFSCELSAQAQDGLTPEAIDRLFGDLNRPADVLLAEADATVARGTLAMRLTVYMEIQGHLNERRAYNVEELETEPGTKIDNKENAAVIEQFERGLKQTESEIRQLSAKLASSWLLPVQTNIDEQQAAAALRNAQVLVTIGSKSGEVLEPTKLTLTAPGVSPVGFVQISPGVYLACNVSPGEYQLAWQLTPKSIVQRVPRITVDDQGCVACAVTLGMPDIQCTTKRVDSIVIPQRTGEPRLCTPIVEPESPTPDSQLRK